MSVTHALAWLGLRPAASAVAGTFVVILALMLGGCGGGEPEASTPQATAAVHDTAPGVATAQGAPGAAPAVPTDAEADAGAQAAAASSTAATAATAVATGAEDVVTATGLPETRTDIDRLISLGLPAELVDPGARRTAQAALPVPAPTLGPTCLVNGTLLGQRRLANVIVEGTGCPSSPAPACVTIFSLGPISYCAPDRDLLYFPDAPPFTCPLDYREVTGDPAYAEEASRHGSSRLCLRLDAGPPGQGNPLAPACTLVNRQLVCPVPLPDLGGYNLATDRVAPPRPTFKVPPNFTQQVLVSETGEPTAVPWRLRASDGNGLSGMELLERVGKTPKTQTQSGQDEDQMVVRWRADPAVIAGSGTFFDSGIITLPYTVNDPAKRDFFIRVYDRAGNSARSLNGLRVERFTAPINIASFSVAPAVLPPGGGNVTLTWHFERAGTASIDNGGGAITGGPGWTTGARVLNVTSSTTFTLTASEPGKITKTASAGVTVQLDTTAPTVSLSASPASLAAPGSSTLTAQASDAAGITKVEFYRGNVLIGTDFSAPYQQALSFTGADVGTLSYTAKAYDGFNNVGTSAAIQVTVTPDVTPPTVSLLASPATVVLPGSTTLTATASDASGISKVEFYRGSTLLATDTAAPYAHTVSFGPGDVGNVSFTAKAFDPKGNVATSSAVLVAVSTPIIGDTYASPSGVDAGNTTCAQSTPCLTVGKAASLAGANKTVWLADGVYPRSANAVGGEITVIPAGLTIRAVTPGAVVLHRSLQLQGPATVVGVNMHGGTVTNYFTQIMASSGTVILEGVQFSGMTHPDNALLKLSGTAQVSMSAGALVDYTAALTPSYGGKFATIADSAHLTIQGGSIGSVNGTAMGMAEGNFALNRVPFVLTHSARLSLNNVAIKVVDNGILMNGADTQVNFNGSTLTAQPPGAFAVDGSGIYAYRGSPAITLVNASISGFGSGGLSAGIWVGPNGSSSGLPGVSLTLSVTNAVLNGNGNGIRVTEGSTASLATVTANNLQVKNNVFGGIVCVAACNINLSGGEVSGNGSQVAAVASYYQFLGGLHLGSNVTHSLKLRNVSIINNASFSTSNTNTADNSGVTLGGNASSSFDLGTTASPGGNTFTGNNSGNQTSGIYVKAAAGVVVQAAGNTFIANKQGANAQGKYALGSSPCGASTCDVTGGNGDANYRVVSGTLRLAP